MPGNNFPPTEERAGPEGAEEEPPRVIASTTAPIPTSNTGSMHGVDEEDDAEDEDEGEEQCKPKIRIYTIDIGDLASLNINNAYGCKF